MIWRHGPEGRPQRELVVRMAAMIGNYDYVIDWRFLPDGQIKVSLGATGIVESKMTGARDARVASTNGPDSRADAYGRFVEPNVVAVNHDHYFNFRLDMDVDGADQSRRPRRDRGEDAAPGASTPQHLGHRDQARAVGAGRQD